MKAARITVRVQPRAKANRVVGPATSDAKPRIYVTAPPEGGKANKAAIVLLADHLGVPPSSIAIVRGETSRDKVLAIDGMNADEVLARLGATAAG